MAAALRTSFPVTNILDYGARAGDPQVDNSIPIQRAIDAARINGGGTIYVPIGTYYCQSPLVLDYACGVSLVGAAKASGTGPSRISFLPPKAKPARSLISARSVQGLSIRDLTLEVYTEFSVVFANGMPTEGIFVDIDRGPCPGDLESCDISISDCAILQTFRGDFKQTHGYSAELIRLGDGATRITLSRCSLLGGRNGVAGDGASSVLIQECLFGSGGPSTSIRLRRRCDGWTITSCSFELTGATSSEDTVDQNGMRVRIFHGSCDNWNRVLWCVKEDGKPLNAEDACQALVFMNNWIGDENLVPCDAVRVVASGLYMVGNMFYGATAQSFVVLHEGTSGAFIAGNFLHETSKMKFRVDAGARGVALVGNNSDTDLFCVDNPSDSEPFVVLGCTASPNRKYPK